MATAARSNAALIIAILIVFSAAAVSARVLDQSYDVVNVTFKLTQKVEYGQGIVLAGNITELGSWDVSKAPLMNIEGESNWYYSVDLKPGTWLEFKPVLVVYDTKEVICWQPGGNIVYVIGEHSPVSTVFMGTFQCNFQAGEIKQVIDNI